MAIFERCLQVWCGAHPAIIQWLPQALFPAVKQSQHETDRTSPSSFKVKNTCSYASPLCFHGIELDDFTLYLHLRTKNEITNAAAFCAFQGFKGLTVCRT